MTEIHIFQTKAHMAASIILLNAAPTGGISNPDDRNSYFSNKMKLAAPGAAQ
jgi:hypothetical protein